MRCHAHSSLCCNCGHNPPIVVRNEGTVEKLDATATVLGLFLDWECSVAQVELRAGHVLAIYTDGIPDTIGHSGEEFGEARLVETLRKNQHLDAACILQNVENAVQQFRFAGQEDDLTLVVARMIRGGDLPSAKEGASYVNI